jgi:hypothetical protein
MCDSLDLKVLSNPPAVARLQLTADWALAAGISARF